MEPPAAEDPGENPAAGGGAGGGSDDSDEVVMHPNVPRRGPLLLAFAAITVCGSLGALIGYGLVDTSCQEQPSLLERLLESVRGYHAATHNCGAARAGGSVVGAVLAAIGAGIVTVLMLRAMAEWRVTRPDGPPG
jgi:hypothetical protein